MLKPKSHTLFISVRNITGFTEHSPASGKEWILLAGYVSHGTGTETSIQIIDPQSPYVVPLWVIEPAMPDGSYPPGIFQHIDIGADIFFMQTPINIVGVKVTSAMTLKCASAAAGNGASILVEEINVAETP